MYTNNYHTGRRLQRGRGIGSIFSSIFRSILPIGRKILNSDTTKLLGKSVGKSLKEAAVGTALDALEGKNLKQAAQSRLNESKRKIAQAIRGTPKYKRFDKKKKPSLLKQKIRKTKGYYLLD